MIDSDALGDLIAELVGEHVERALAPMTEANAELARQNAALAAQVKSLEEQLAASAAMPAEPDMGFVRDAAVSAAREVLAEIGDAEPIAPDMDAIGKDIDARIVAALGALPPVEPVALDMEVIRGMLADIVAAIPPAKDGLPGTGVAGAVKRADGHLILTLSNGEMVDIGRVDGRDGKNGETFTLDDFDIEPIDERTIKLCFEKGGERHSFELAFPVPVYRGVWREGATYARGDMVTWAGSCWHCDAETDGKPGDAADHWTLAVKAGRPGRDKN